MNINKYLKKFEDSGIKLFLPDGCSDVELDCLLYELEHYLNRVYVFCLLRDSVLVIQPHEEGCYVCTLVGHDHKVGSFKLRTLEQKECSIPEEVIGLLVHDGEDLSGRIVVEGEVIKLRVSGNTKSGYTVFEVPNRRLKRD